MGWYFKVICSKNNSSTVFARSCHADNGGIVRRFFVGRIVAFVSTMKIKVIRRAIWCFKNGDGFTPSVAIAFKAKQCAQLSIMNIPYRINVRGEPLVTIAYINGLKAEPIKTGWQSNLMAA